MLAAEGHDVRAVPTAGEARSQIIIIEDDLRITVLNEPGAQLSPGDPRALLDAVREELPATACWRPAAACRPARPTTSTARSSSWRASPAC